MKVRCGLMSATEAANKLGVSRKTYYKWEQRGLAALMNDLQDKPSGRHPTAERSKRETDLAEKISALEKDNELLIKKMELKDLVHQMELDTDTSRSKKK